MLNENFTFRLSLDERQMLEKLGRHLRRTQADTLRLLIRESTRQIQAECDQVQAPVPKGSCKFLPNCSEYSTRGLTVPLANSEHASQENKHRKETSGNEGN